MNTTSNSSPNSRSIAGGNPLGRFLQNLSISRKLGLSSGLLILLLIVSAAVSIYSLRAINQGTVLLAQVIVPLQEAALEMEINTGERFRDVEEYLLNQTPETRELAQNQVEDFERFQLEFNRLAQTDEERSLGEQVALQFAAFQQNGDEAMAIADQQTAVLTSFFQIAADIDTVFDEQLQAGIDRTSADAPAKVEASLEMELNAREYKVAIEDYLANPDPAIRARADDSLADFEKFEAAYRATTLTTVERGQLDQINTKFAEFQQLGSEILDLEDQARVLDAQLIEDLTTIDATLDEQIQPLIKENTTQAETEVVTRITTTTTTVLIFSLIGLFVGGGAALLIARSIVSALATLTHGADLFGQGQIEHRMELDTKDETGALATAFNIMAENIQNITENVQRRAAELATVAEVSTATSTILDVKSLLQEVVNLTKERFNLYHSHIYLLDEAGENLVLSSGAGEPGRQMVAEGRSIRLDNERSLVARAAREQKGVTVNDVTQAPDFLPNPLLPDTRSELAVPMIVGGKVIGVFDVQSDVVARFTDSDINIQTTLAAQISTSIQNVRSFEQSKTQADFESLVNTIGQKIQRAATVEDTLQIAIRELGSVLGATRVKAILNARPNDGAKEGAH